MPVFSDTNSSPTPPKVAHIYRPHNLSELTEFHSKLSHPHSSPSYRCRKYKAIGMVLLSNSMLRHRGRQQFLHWVRPSRAKSSLRIAWSRVTFVTRNVQMLPSRRNWSGSVSIFTLFSYLEEFEPNSSLTRYH